jgi:hypothetical protein
MLSLELAGKDLINNHIAVLGLLGIASVRTYGKVWAKMCKSLRDGLTKATRLATEKALLWHGEPDSTGATGVGPSCDITT